MDKEKFMSQLAEGTIVFEDWDTFSKGIVGVTPDRCHVIYDYDKLAEALKDSFLPDSEGEDDAYVSAIEWLEYNTLRTLPYLPSSSRPIVLMNEEEAEDYKFEEFVPAEQLRIAV